MSTIEATGISGADVAQRVDDMKKRDDSLNITRNDVAQKTKATADVLQSYIYQNANPNPAVVVIAVLIVLLGMWVIYVALIKPSLRGSWRDVDGSMWKIHHNMFSGTLTVKHKHKDGRIVAGYGDVNDNLFRFDNYMGVWNYGDIVLFVGGGGMQRVHE